MLQRDECIALSKQQAQRLMQRFPAAEGPDATPLLRYTQMDIPRDGRAMWWIARDSHERVPRVTRCPEEQSSRKRYYGLWFHGLRLFLVEAFAEEREPLRPFLVRAIQEREAPPVKRMVDLRAELVGNALLLYFQPPSRHGISGLEKVPVIAFLANRPARVCVTYIAKP